MLTERRFKLDSIFDIPEGMGQSHLTGDTVRGPGGDWLPHVVEVLPGQFVGAICRTAPGVSVVGFLPVFTDLDRAAQWAEAMARLAAE